MSENKSSRPSWDEYFMAIARIAATRSTCDRLHAGAVLVKNKRIIATGYNGSPAGLSHCDDVGHLMEDGHCVRTIHAEHNVLLQCALSGASPEGSTLYSVYSPCIHCAKYIVSCGVKRVVMGKIYRNSDIVNYFKEAGVPVDIYQENESWLASLRKIFSSDMEEVKENAVKLNVNAN